MAQTRVDIPCYDGAVSAQVLDEEGQKLGAREELGVGFSVLDMLRVPNSYCIPMPKAQYADAGLQSRAMRKSSSLKERTRQMARAVSATTIISEVMDTRTRQLISVCPLPAFSTFAQH